MPDDISIAQLHIVPVRDQQSQIFFDHEIVGDQMNDRNEMDLFQTFADSMGQQTPQPFPQNGVNQNKVKEINTRPSNGSASQLTQRLAPADLYDPPKLNQKNDKSGGVDMNIVDFNDHFGDSVYKDTDNDDTVSKSQKFSPNSKPNKIAKDRRR